MSLENEEQQAARSTVGRSIRLSTDVMTRLQAVLVLRAVRRGSRM